MKWSLLLLPLAGCVAMPQDAEGTSERIAATRVVRIGWVAGADDGRGTAKRLIAVLAAETGARPQLVRGAAEPLLAALEADQVDLVIGPFDKDSPWVELVTFAPPLGEQRLGEATLYLRAAVKNGENAWAMRVERLSRTAAPDLASKS